MGLFQVDPDFGHDSRFFARVQRVVDRLLDGGQEGLARVVETQQVAVLGEELAHRDIALLGRHGFSGGATARLAVGTGLARLLASLAVILGFRVA